MLTEVFGTTAMTIAAINDRPVHLEARYREFTYRDKEGEERKVGRVELYVEGRLEAIGPLTERDRERVGV